MPFDTGHALVIGVGTYAKAPQLAAPATAEEARQVAQVLANPRACGYPPAQVQLLTGEVASRQRILAALDDLAANTTVASTVLVFYSGHGLFGADGYYLTANDTEIDAGTLMCSTGIRETQLIERLRRIPARRALLLFNACHSGAIAPGSLSNEALVHAPGAPLPDQLATALLATGEGRVVITACKEAQQSYYDLSADTTLFGQALLDALVGRGVTSRRGYISVFDLYDYVYHYVSGEVRRRWQQAQEPLLTIHQGVGVMAVALRQGSAPGADLTPPERPTMLSGAAREIDPGASQAVLHQILTGELNLAAGRNITGNTIVHGDQTHISGDYAGGSVDKRSGAFVSGGTVYGTVVGVNTGSITSSYDFSAERGLAAHPTLRDARQQLRQLLDAVAARGEQQLAADLDGVEQLLSAAIQAEHDGDAAQRARKLRQAKGDLLELALNRPDLQAVAQALGQLG